MLTRPIVTRDGPVPGRIEEVLVESPGFRLKKEQPLVKIYSPNISRYLEFSRRSSQTRAQADPKRR